MLKYILGGVGLTLIGIGSQTYIELLQPYSKLLISFGIILFSFPVVFTLAKKLRLNKATLPKGIYFSGNDLYSKYKITPFELKQRIEKGLPAYTNDSDTYRTDNLREITERDLIALEVWHDTANSKISNWFFKSEDVEKYIKNT